MKKRALIIGAAGFVGSYLIREIQEGMHWGVDVTKMAFEELDFPTSVGVYDLDIMDREAIISLLREVHPDYIFHLAAQSSVAVSWKNPDLTVDVNIKGSIHVLDSVRELDYKPRVLMVGSSEEYGYAKPEEIPINESVLTRPGNIYAATKACQNMISAIYAKAYQMDVISVRAFNHIGPTQSPQFVVADFCKQVADIEAGRIPDKTIHVGNLSAKKDFTDVRDVVRAYCMLMEHGISGETYNIGSGHAISIDDILHMIIDMSDADIKVVEDPERVRPIEVPIIEADISKLVEATGWQRQIPLEQTIRETLDRWRKLTIS